MNGVSMARHMLILGEDEATTSRKPLKHLLGPPGPVFGPEATPKVKNLGGGGRGNVKVPLPHTSIGRGQVTWYEAVESPDGFTVVSIVRVNGSSGDVASEVHPAFERSTAVLGTGLPFKGEVGRSIRK